MSGLSKLCIYDRSDVAGAEERFDPCLVLVRGTEVYILMKAKPAD